MGGCSGPPKGSDGDKKRYREGRLGGLSYIL